MHYCVLSPPISQELDKESIKWTGAIRSSRQVTKEDALSKVGLSHIIMKSSR